ncbi:MAG TPA: hypothetical protein VGX25_04085 [Actinophytocola sp.]|uniref:hypothetical protein n=1 Tax=Actinophytocola sp. TaxID=1872138 RepID=UPI002DDCC758|nr:hypothetical protein [Actinophytocola sp.]HEV2778558.1 hypothetical protein [Actinophytocola sp.]
MTDDLFGRIDRTLAECDARQLPPLAAAADPAGAGEHLVVVEADSGRIIHPQVVPVAEAARLLGYEPAELSLTEPTRRRWLRWPWRPRRSGP